MSIFQIIIFFLCLLIIGPTATATATAAGAGVGVGVGVGGAEEQEAVECMPRSCSKHHHHGPQIRFPFRLKGLQPKHCGYPHPAFDLSCSTTTHSIYPVLELPFSVTVSVIEIDYKSQAINISDPDDCFPRHLQNLDLSASPFQLVTYHNYSHYDDVTFINCSGTQQYYGVPIDCLSDHSHQVYATWSFYTPRLSCIKMYNMSIPAKHDYYFAGGLKFDVLRLNWTKPICGKCEAQGKYCRLTKNNNSNQTECFDKPKQSNTSAWKKLKVPSEVLGPSLLGVVIVVMYHVYRSKKEDQVKIDKFLEDYKALKPARYSYTDIKKITNQFEDKVGQGGYGTVYKGKLSNDVHVAVKILNNVKGNGDEFINEVQTMGRIHHINVVRLVGYCADGFRRALLYEFLPNNSLDKFISSNQEKRSLGWEKLQDIALGIAKGIEYLHIGCDQRILHFDIKPHNILLDHKFNPKISDFGLAKLCSKEQSAVSMTAARGTVGYIAPEVFSRNFGNVSYKSDVYSFGMLLLEMVGGRQNTVTLNSSENYFPDWIYKRLDRGEELGIQIEKEGDAKIVKKLTIVGLWCIQWYPIDRPSMKVVVQMLEGDGGTLTVPPSPFASTNPMPTSGTMGGRTFTSELEIISESE